MNILVYLCLFVGCDAQKERDLSRGLLVATQPKTQTEIVTSQEKAPKDMALGTPHDAQLSLLQDSQTAPEGIAKLVDIGEPALSSLSTLVNSSQDMIAKGWGIQAIGKISGQKSTDLLHRIEADDKQDQLSKAWAGAALVQRCNTIDELLNLMSLVQKYPALQRPVGMKLETLSGGMNPLQALELSLKIPQLQATLQPMILQGDPSLLIEAMLTHADMNIRRQSAGYLATMGRSNSATIPALLKAYDFTPSAREVIWKGGPLYVPSISWDKENGTALFSHLVSWYLFCDKNNLQQEKQQLYNNMRSVTLLGAIGMPRYLQNDTRQILQGFLGVVGTRQVQIMLEEQGMMNTYGTLVGGR